MNTVPATLLALVLVHAGGLRPTLAQHESPEVAKQGKPIEIGTSFTLHSEILDETRRVLIYTPRSLLSGKQRYPVLYLLDGPSHFHHTSGTVKFLADHGRMPETIVVAVANTKRTRDLTPSASDEMGDMNGGGANNFLSFLCDELTPWVDARYPTRPMRMLIGHSFGGLFAVNAMIRRPGFFQGIIAISPSMQWDSQRLVGEVDQWLQARNDLKGSIFITAGNEGVGLLGGSMKVAGILSEHAPKGMRWKFTHMPNETHGTVPHRSTYDGLEWLFDGWTLRDPLATFDAGGFAAIESHYARVRQPYGYDDRVPIRVVTRLFWRLLRKERSPELAQLLGKIDHERYAIPAYIYADLASELMPDNDAAGKAILVHGLRVFPGNTSLRQAGKQAGLQLPPKPKPPASMAVPAETLATYVGSHLLEVAGSRQ